MRLCHLIMSSPRKDQDSSKCQVLLLDALKGNNVNELQALLDGQKLRKKELIEKRTELEAYVRSEREEVIATIDIYVNKKFVKLNELKKQVHQTSEEKLPPKLENPEIYVKLDQLTALDKSSSYLHVVTLLRTGSERICELLESGETTSALDVFQFLHQVQEIHLRGSQCLSLTSYCSTIVTHWEKEFHKLLSKDFEEALEKIGWPLRVIQASPSDDEKQQFQSCATSIVRFSNLIPHSDKPKGNKMVTILADYQDPILPILIMVKPLKKRFRFNFFGSNATSKDSKPEWYFSQVKHWIRDLVPFLQTHVEPLSVTLIKLSCVVEFIRALSELLIIKADFHLSACMESEDNVTFVKILEEAIIYENEVGQVLRESVEDKYFIPPFVSTLFSQPEVLKRWLDVEKNACQQKLDEIFSSPSAWDRAVVPGPPEVVHLFLALLRFITGRFSHLPQPGHRIQFLQLLVNMVDDFRYRCLQIWKSRSGSVEDITSDMLFDYVMADALWHVQQALDTWEDLPIFESLSFFLDNIQEAEERQLRSGRMDTYCEIGFPRSEAAIEQVDEINLSNTKASIGIPNLGLFSKVQELYTCLGQEILATWLISVEDDIGASILRGYTNKKWHSLPEASPDFPDLKVSVELLLPLQKISSLCKTVEEGLSSEIAQKWLKRLAVTLDSILMQNLITTTSFSTGAIRQLKHDFIYGFFPIFSLYNIEVSIFFTGLTCTIKVWDMAIGDALLILDDLTSGGSGNFQVEEILAELEINLKPSEVLRLLKTRADIETVKF